MNKIKVSQIPESTSEIVRIQNELKEKGYALSSDSALGIPPEMRQYLDNRFFTDHVLGPEIPGVSPIDRLRACDVVEFRRKKDQLELEEFPIVTLKPIKNMKEPREYKRVLTLEDPKFVNWIGTLFKMVPPDEQQTHGTLGFHFLRTFNDLVAYKHQDGEQYVIIYIAARETDGALTSLYPIDQPDTLLLEVAIQPGEYLIFRDRDFMHDASPLRPRFEGDKQYRDALITLVHYPTTYLTAPR